MLYKEQNPSPIFRITIGSNNLFYFKCRQFRVFKIAKFEPRKRYIMVYGKNTQLWLLDIRVTYDFQIDVRI